MQNSLFRILFAGDVVGAPGRTVLKASLPLLRQEYGVDCVIANGENAAGGSGLTPSIITELLACGVDVITSGDHIWRNKEVFAVIDTSPRLLRPLNYPPMSPGKGCVRVEFGDISVAVINLIGRVFMEPVDCPFRAIDALLSDFQQTDIIIVDFHAEATAEKIAMGWYLDGRVTLIAGTHTHVQTADEQILPKGSAYITDAGMTGPMQSVIGREVEPVLQRFITHVPARFKVARERPVLNGVLVSVSKETGKAVSIERLQRGTPE